MKKILLLLLFISAAFLCNAQKIVPIYFKQDPGIVIDGRLDRNDWADINSEVTFLPGKGKQGGGRVFKFKGPKDISGSVKVAYRGDGPSLHITRSKQRFVPLCFLHVFLSLIGK